MSPNDDINNLWRKDIQSSIWGPCAGITDEECQHIHDLIAVNPVAVFGVLNGALNTKGLCFHITTLEESNMSDKDDKIKPGSFQYTDPMISVPSLLARNPETELRRMATGVLSENHCTCRKGIEQEYKHNEGHRQDYCLWCVCYDLIEKLDKYHEWKKSSIKYVSATSGVDVSDTKKTKNR
jgi:hypothetical protein